MRLPLQLRSLLQAFFLWRAISGSTASLYNDGIGVMIARSTRAYVSLSLIALIWLALLLAMPLSGARAEGLSDARQAQNALQFAEKSRWHDALLHAQGVKRPALGTLVRWLYYLEPDSGAGFDEIAEFLESNPNWPEQRKLQIRAEQALKYGNADDATLRRWFEAKPPITGTGKLALARALMENGAALADESIVTLIREAWRGGDFDEPTEEQIQSDYADALRTEDHRARIDRLLWEEKISAAERILRLVPDAQALFRTRIALIRDDREAMQLLAQLPASVRDDPGLIYDRMQWRARRDDDEGVREMLLAAPENPPYPQKWWKRREQQVRGAINRDEYRLARRLLANHGQQEGQEYAEALWLSGWLALEFEKKPERAYDAFTALYNAVKYPNSRARGAYWAARAAQATGDKDSARGWYEAAAAYPTTFYGQAAAARRHEDAPLRFPANPEPPAEAKRALERNDLAQAVRIAAGAGQDGLAQKLLQHLIESLDDPGQIELAARIGAQLRRTQLAVRGSKLAQQKNVLLTDVGYPRLRLPADLAPEPSLILAVARQESEFDPGAQSPSGARGMMQLMPRTAKEVARKLKIGFSIGKLYEPGYNFRLGSAYLERLLNSYGGSYVMAVAAYNAGPGRVREWRDAFGDPGQGMESAIRWIERIPFTETRDYVQRVMANLQVYRHLDSRSLTKLALAEDLER